MSDDNSKLVYSTDRPVPGKGKAVGNISETDVHPGLQKVRVRLERKGRGGKAVTVIDGLILHRRELGDLLRQLKAKLGTGGAVKGAVLEIQGDHCNPVISALEKKGYKPKRSGG
jgi:translation initiation factor 1